MALNITEADVGKTFVDGHGRKHVIKAIVPECRLPVWALCRDGDMEAFKQNGMYHADPASLYNLVSEYVEPRKPREGYHIIHKDKALLTKEEATEMMTPETILVRVIEVLE